MNIKSTRTKNIQFDWNISDYIPIDKLTFVFSIVVGTFLGLVTMGFGHAGPVMLVMGLSVVIGGFGAIDSGSKGFIYVLRLGIYTIIMSNLIILYPSSTINYEKKAVSIVHTTDEVRGVKKIAIQIFDTTSNELIITKYYDIDKKVLVDTLYKNTKFAQYNVEYTPIVKYKKYMRFYDD